MPKKTPHILILGLVWAEPESTGASKRLMQHIAMFQSLGWLITFACAAANNDATKALQTLGVNTQKVTLNCNSFDDFIADLKPNVVMFDRFMVEEQFGWRVANTCPQALRVLETIDLHCLREARHQAFKTKQTFHLDMLNNDIALREIAAIYRNDVSIIISNYEHDLLQSHFNIDPSLLHLCPFMLETPDTNTPNFEQRQHFMTIGNFRHAPNWDAVLWLKQEVWGLIRQQLPKAELHIYGAYTPPKATALHNAKEGFLIKDKAVSVQDVMQASRVCLAPLRFGAGIKTKLADAMMFGTPSVTTNIGAEGMIPEHKGSDLDWAGNIADDAQAFADAAVALYQDKEMWETAQNNGYNIVNTLFNKESNQQALLNRLFDVQNNLETYRQKNFMGLMLNHHHHRSTEFMSRWIEAKNA
ncbi:MAG TPA: glycosyltransferase [Ghiorsea sp.]|nr:glycosyltransferase [Ghiorsea sp.]HIP07744.1 glycosyltransferase [Mariprofundaceae bacterium]